MHIHHVLARIDKRASGLTYAVPGICAALHAEGIPTTLHVASDPLQEYAFKVRSYSKWPVFQNIGVSPALLNGLNKLQGEKIILHNHSLWTIPSLFAGILTGRQQLRMMFSPHGTLSPEALEQSRWKKNLFWSLGQKQTLQNASCFHVTSLSEAQDIRRLGYSQPIAYIPLGLEVYPLQSRDKNSYNKILFLARLHPHKGVDMLIEVWKKINQRFPDWELQIVGPEDYPGYSSHLQILAGQNNRISFTDAVFGEEKQRLFNTSSLYVLPSRSENFGVTIAEALLAGLPVIVTKSSPWHEVEHQGFGWWIENTHEGLETALAEAMTLDADTRTNMGLKGREFVMNTFSWERAGKALKSVYEWMLEDGPRPECILD